MEALRKTGHTEDILAKEIRQVLNNFGIEAEENTEAKEGAQAPAKDTGNADFMAMLVTTCKSDYASITSALSPKLFAKATGDSAEVMCISKDDFIA